MGRKKYQAKVKLRGGHKIPTYPMLCPWCRTDIGRWSNPEEEKKRTHCPDCRGGVQWDGSKFTRTKIYPYQKEKRRN